MNKQLFTYFTLVVFLLACQNSTLADASSNFKANGDYDSLRIIFDNLSVGLDRDRVDAILGEPDYSPTDGQYYYYSDREGFSEEAGRELVIGLVVDFNDDDGMVADKLQSFHFGFIGE